MVGSKKAQEALMFLVMAAIVLMSVLTPMLSSGNAGGFTTQNAALKVKATKASYTVPNGILGIDVSKYQGKIDWKKVAGDGVKFAFVRSNYGTTADPYFVTNVKGAYDNKIKAGAYHYATFKDSSSMKKEASAFIKQLKRVTVTYPVVLDLEHSSHGLSKKNLTTLASQFMGYLSKEGYTVMLYSGENYIKKNVDLNSVGNYDLWVANYLQKPSVGKSFKVWQYSCTGRISGISGAVDMNVALTDLSTKKGSGSSSSSSSSSAASSSSIAESAASSQEEKAPASTVSVSDSIKTLINERYGSTLEVGVDQDLSIVNTEIHKAFQKEINTQLGGSIEVNGVLDAAAVDKLSTLSFVLNQTNGRITCLIQSKLYYEGHYTEKVTGYYDDHTFAAIKAFQSANSLEATGNMDKATWAALLGVSLS